MILLRAMTSVVLFTAWLVMTPAAGASSVRFVSIAFDPPGEDRKPEPDRDLNREFVVIRNSSSRVRSLGGWKLHDRGRSIIFVFTRNSRLRPGDRVVLHTGRGRSIAAVSCNGECVTTHHLYLGLANYVWNNRGDTATLRDGAGRIVAQCRYRARAESPIRC